MTHDRVLVSHREEIQCGGIFENSIVVSECLREAFAEETIEFEVERLLVESSSRRGTVLRRRAKVKSK